MLNTTNGSVLRWEEEARCDANTRRSNGRKLNDSSFEEEARNWNGQKISRGHIAAVEAKAAAKRRIASGKRPPASGLPGHGKKPIGLIRSSDARASGTRRGRCPVTRTMNRQPRPSAARGAVHSYRQGLKMRRTRCPQCRTDQSGCQITLRQRFSSSLARPWLHLGH